MRFTDGNFSDDPLTTIGIDTKKKFIKCDGKKIELDIWDTAGQERFRAITKNCFKGADGIILMFDLSKRKTFTNIKTWMNNIKDLVDFTKSSLIVVGNKCDVEESLIEVDEEMKKRLIQEHNITLVIASAKKNTNVTETFTALIEKMMKLGIGKKIKASQQLDDEDDEENDEKNRGGKKLKDSSEKKKKKCCGGSSK